MNNVRLLLKSPRFMIGLVVLLAILAFIFIYPLIDPGDPMEMLSLSFEKPGTVTYTGKTLVLGSDNFGRDAMLELVYGTRTSLFVGLIGGSVTAVIGLVVGLAAGYMGGKINTVIMRTVDVFYAFPSVLLAIALSGALGAGIGNALLSLTLVFVPQVARIAESVTAQVRHMDYIDAARATGASALTIIRVQVLGNVLGPIFVFSTGLISVCMILASGLSFLGLGVRPPEPEWGLMLNTLRTAIYTQPWVAALPGLMIFITSISFNILADRLRAAMAIKE